MLHLGLSKHQKKIKKKKIEQKSKKIEKNPKMGNFCYSYVTFFGL